MRNPILLAVAALSAVAAFLVGWIGMPVGGAILSLSKTGQQLRCMDVHICVGREAEAIDRNMQPAGVQGAVRASCNENPGLSLGPVAMLGAQCKQYVLVLRRGNLNYKVSVADGVITKIETDTALTWP